MRKFSTASNSSRFPMCMSSSNATSSSLLFSSLLCLSNQPLVHGHQQKLRDPRNLHPNSTLASPARISGLLRPAASLLYVHFLGSTAAPLFNNSHAAAKNLIAVSISWRHRSSKLTPIKATFLLNGVISSPELALIFFLHSSTKQP